MVDLLPTVDDLYKTASGGSSGELPTTDELYNQASTPQKGFFGTLGHAVLDTALDNPITGPIADMVFNQGPYNRIAKAFGQSFEQQYGLTGVNPDFEKTLQESGVWNDYKDGKFNLLKAVNEAWMRPVISTGTAALGILQGVGGATTQVARELDTTARQLRDVSVNDPTGLTGALATVVGGTGEITGSLPEGFLPELHIPEMHVARANAVIGEDEAGYFGTKPPTAEQVVERNEAAGAIPVTEPVVQPTLPVVARQIAPDTFTEYDALKAQRDNYRQQLEELGPTQTVNPRAAELQANIDSILSKVAGDEDRLTKAAAERLRRSQTALENMSLREDTPEMAEIREKLSKIDYRMRDLAPDVATAYRLASERLNTASEEPVQTVSEGSLSQTPETETTRPTGAQRQEAAVSLITEDVTRKLIAAGRPEEEAQAAAQIVSAYYDTRAARFEGKLGTGLELYNKEGPEIVSETGSKGVQGKLIVNSARNTIKLFKTANGSTFLHETGHDWLERLQQDAVHEQTPTDVILDKAIVDRWLKRDETKPLTKAMHEKWARGFERYLMEGIAPTKELAGVFLKFKQWLTKIYRIVSNLKSPISEDIRDVFSRMLSTDPDYNRSVTLVPDVEEDLTSKTLTKTEQDSLPVEPKDKPKTSNSPVSFDQTKYIDKAGNVRLDNLTSDEDVSNYLRSYADQNRGFLNTRKGVVTRQDIIDSAEMLADSPRKMNANINRLRKISTEDGISLAARILGLRQALIQSTQEIMNMVLSENPMGYATASIRHLRLQQTLAGITAEWGRAGHAFQVSAESSQTAEAVSEYLQANLGRTFDQVKADMNRIRQLKTPQQISGMVKDLQKASLGEMGLELFKNYLISGPVTHLMYTIGNKVGMFMKAGPETLATSIVGDIREKITGVKSEVGERVYSGEVGQGLYAFLFGQRDGLKAMWDSAKAGQTLPLPGEDLASTPFTATKKIPGIAGTIIRAPGERMVAPIHSADRTVGYLTARAQLIYRQAVDEGLTPGTEPFSARMAEMYNSTPEDIMKAARDSATEGALMGPAGNLTRRVQALTTWEVDLPVLGRTQPLGFISPFVHVSGNIMRMSFLERSPIGFFSADVRGLNGTLAQDTAISRAVVGTAVWGALGGLYLEGMINPAAPADYKEAAVSRMTDGLPHSVRIGDMSFAFDRLGIWGSQLTVGADIMHSIGHGIETGDVTGAGVEFMKGMYHHLTSEGFLSGISDLMKAIDESDKYGDSWARNFVSTLAVPFSIGMTQIAQRVDPYSRQAKTLTDAMVARVPFLSETLHPRIDIFGNPVPNKDFWGVYAQQVSDDPILKVMENSGYFPAPVSKKIRGVELTPDQYEDYARKAGALLHQQLGMIIKLPNFVDMKPKMQFDLIKNAVTQSRSSAASAIMMKYPDIMKQAIANKTGLVEGFTQ